MLLERALVSGDDTFVLSLAIAYQCDLKGWTLGLWAQSSQ